MRRIPAICFDIDGVLYRGKRMIPGADQVIKYLRKQVQTGVKVPFALVTNGGGVPEHQRAEVVNRILGLNDSTKIKGEEMVLCHTPFKRLLPEYKDDLIMVGGLHKPVEVAQHYGFKKVIDVLEYSSVFSQLCRLGNTGQECTQLRFTQDFHEENKRRVQNRLGRAFVEQPPPPVKAFLLINDPTHWETNFQIATDLLVSKDGIPGSVRKSTDPQFTKLFISNPDFLYSDSFKLPRFAQGPFLDCLRLLFKKQYGFKFEVEIQGKPTKVTFEYAQNLLEAKARAQNTQISNYYMIGDNPSGDIRGANAMGWSSILVRTGVFQMQHPGAKNDPVDPASHVVNDVNEALALIKELEQL